MVIDTETLELLEDMLIARSTRAFEIEQHYSKYGKSDLRDCPDYQYMQGMAMGVSDVILALTGNRVTYHPDDDYLQRVPLCL